MVPKVRHDLCGCGTLNWITDDVTDTHRFDVQSFHSTVEIISTITFTINRSAPPIIRLG